MRSRLLSIFGIVLFGALAATVGEAQNVKPSVVTGDVVSVSDSSIVLKSKDGDITVTLSDKTEYKRVPPENPSLKAAVASSLTDIGVGDKLMVTGVFGDDKTTLPSRAVYLMTKSDIAQKNTKESEAWRTRGITGRVASVDPQTKAITVEVRGLMGSSNVAVTPKDSAKFRRYAPDSVKFSEAKSSSLDEIKSGDMIRALGDRSADNVSFAAEEIVTGAFQTIAGTVKSVDAAKNEIVLTDFQTKKDVTVTVGASSMLKKFPEEMAQRMAQFQGGGAGGIRPAGQGTQAGPPQGQAPGGQGRGGFGSRGGGGIDDMLERFPNITAADLKAGDMIAVSSTKTANADRITAIKLLAGVEPFLRAAQAQNGAGRGRGGQGDFNIPGLDGISFP